MKKERVPVKPVRAVFDCSLKRFRSRPVAEEKVFNKKKNRLQSKRLQFTMDIGIVQCLDRSGEKPYCTFIICIRLHFVNTFFKTNLSPAASPDFDFSAIG
ncbi:hypothetical protein [Paenibacillus typhae]|uniref:Uncharacterized protein n=1 Tax=Paenibacillus typhae TaxID=1174501 RepID=A0A1G9G0U6_9BACL|nr:hypothetical protein [Paenibacillus typhae]SDK94260.1 hypothetical protein SAMN05216192_16226 [Paenibacillus typhae]